MIYEEIIIKAGLPVFTVLTTENNNSIPKYIIGWELPLLSQITNFIGIFYQNQIHYMNDLKALELISVEYMTKLRNKNVIDNEDNIVMPNPKKRRL
jgi:hypothetical protein